MFRQLQVLDMLNSQLYMYIPWSVRQQVYLAPSHLLNYCIMMQSFLLLNKNNNFHALFSHFNLKETRCFNIGYPLCVVEYNRKVNNCYVIVMTDLLAPFQVFPNKNVYFTKLLSKMKTLPLFSITKVPSYNEQIEAIYFSMRYNTTV